MADSEERPIPFRAAREARPSSCKDGPTAKVGRPKVTITEDVLERRRLSKRRQNARRNIQQGAPPTGILNVSSRGIPPPGQSSSQLDATDGGEASNAEEDLHMDNSAEGSGLEQGSGVDNVAGGQADPGSGETRRQRASINRKKKEFKRPIPFRAAREARPSSCKDGPTAKVGRPKVTITEDVLERRRLSKRRQNARRNIQQGAPPTGILNVSSRGIPLPGQSSSQLDATDGGEASNAG